MPRAKSDVARAAIGRLAQILAMRDIRVTLRGETAFCESDADGKPIRINLPNLPDDAPAEALAGAQGYLDHEVAHALFTDFASVRVAAEDGSTLKDLHNLVEDTLIERRMAERFRGSEHNLEATRQLVLDTIVGPSVAARRAAGAPPGDLLLALLMPIARAWAGQPSMIAFMADKWEWIEEPLSAIAPLAERFPQVADSWDSLQLARDLLEALRNSVGDVRFPTFDDEALETLTAGARGAVADDDAGGPDDVGADGARADAVFGRRSDRISGVDFGSALAASLTRRARAAQEAGEWRVFTTEFDRVAPYDAKIDDHLRAARALSNSVETLIGPMARELERLILAQNRIVWRGGLRRGRLNGAALHRLATGDDRVFRRREDHRALNTAVSLLIDLSGSMRGSKITVACGCAYAMARILDACRVPNEVVGFTTRAPHDAMTREAIEELNSELAAHGAEPDGRRYRNLGQFSRLEPLEMPIFKGFDERLTPDVRARLAAAPQDGDLMNNNIDHECVAIAGRRLSARAEPRRILIVFSDGAPAFVGDVATSERLLIREIAALEAAGVEVLGVGIGTEDVAEFYPKHAVVQSVSDLPKAFLGELKRALLR